MSYFNIKRSVVKTDKEDKEDKEERKWNEEWFNTLIQTIDKELINWELLSQNPNITWDIIQKNKHLPWKFRTLHLNPNITMKIIIENPDKDWEYRGIINWEKLKEEKDSENYDFFEWYYLSMNSIIHFKDIKQNLSKPWDWFGLSANPNMKFNIVKQNIGFPWDIKGLCANINFGLDEIKEVIDLKKIEYYDLDWHSLSQNPNITWKIIIENPDKPWSWYGISKNKNINWDIIESNPNNPWDWIGISLNPSINWDIIKSNLNKRWCWSYICKNPMSVEKEKYISKIKTECFKKNFTTFIYKHNISFEDCIIDSIIYDYILL